VYPLEVNELIPSGASGTGQFLPLKGIVSAVTGL